MARSMLRMHVICGLVLVLCVSSGAFAQPVQARGTVRRMRQLQSAATQFEHPHLHKNPTAAAAAAADVATATATSQFAPVQMDGAALATSVANVLEFGAAGDGKTDNTKPFQVPIMLLFVVAIAVVACSTRF
mgnify:CR=1 FL=1